MQWHAGPPERIALAEPINARKMTYFMPVTLRHDAPALALASARLPSGSGDFLALAGTDGFAELPPHADGYPQGFVADFYRW
jgi:molybdopterin biosynthesis enzyme